MAFRNSALLWAKLIRPHQWVKNGFVLTGVLFSPVATLDQGRQALWLMVAFCFLSSAVYVVNDILDRQVDALHPTKRHRPLASGQLAPGWALVGALLLVALAFSLTWLAGVGGWLATLYLGLQLGYSLWGKHIAVLDVCCISLGFVLRLLAGTDAVGIEPTQWLVLCTVLLTLAMGFAKRRVEWDVAKGSRPVLADYTPGLLNYFVYLLLGEAALAYALYAVSPATQAIHGSMGMVLTVPFVLLGLYRYLSQYRLAGGCPTRTLMTDRLLQVALAGWALTVLVVR